MKAALGLATIALFAAIFSMAWGAMTDKPLPRASTTPFDMSIFNHEEPNSDSDYTGQLEIYSSQDKEHVFQVAPAPLVDPGAANPQRNPGFRSALTPSNQSNMSFALSLPLFGSPEPDRRGPGESMQERVGDIGAA